MNKLEIRTAEWPDLAAIVAIYNQAVDAGQKTADTNPVTVPGRNQWFAAHEPGTYPILVAEYNGIITGYLSISPYRPGRMALRCTAEVSYFIHCDYHHQGVASRLLERALHICPTLGIKTLFAIILETNEYSVRLMEKFGFEKWGHLPRVAEFDQVEVGHLYYGLRIVGERHGKS